MRTARSSWARPDPDTLVPSPPRPRRRAMSPLRSRAAPIDGRVIVVTGATSGLGRAAALEFAGHPPRLVLAARDEDALAVVASECRAAGAAVVMVPTDVSDATAVDALGDRAETEFGGIDIWVSTAAVLIAGDF